jgi:hypothetical protein
MPIQSHGGVGNIPYQERTLYQYKVLFYIGSGIYFMLSSIILGFAGGYNTDYNTGYNNVFKLMNFITLLYMGIHLLCKKIPKIIGHLWLIFTSALVLLYIAIHLLDLEFFIDKNDPRFVYFIWEFINNIHFFSFIFAFYFREIIYSPSFNDKSIMVDICITFFIEYYILSFVFYILMEIYNILKYFKSKLCKFCMCTIFCECNAKIGKEKKECCICLQNITNNQKILECGHCFHKGCIDMWINQNQICPLCRVPV